MQKCEEKINNFGLSEDSKEFIAQINNYHNARYPDFPFHAKNRYLLNLDQAVWEIRFYAQDPNFSKRITKEDIEKFRKERGKNKGNLFMNGYLERVLKNKSGKHQTERSNLIWKNFYFGDRQKKSITFQGGFWAKNNHMFSGGKNSQLEVYKAVQEYIPVSKEIRDYFENFENQN